jgi:hypothetical protein
LLDRRAQIILFCERLARQRMRHRDGVLLAALDVYPLMAMQIRWHSGISITMEIYAEATSEGRVRRT